ALAEGAAATDAVGKGTIGAAEATDGAALGGGSDVLAVANAPRNASDPATTAVVRSAAAPIMKPRSLGRRGGGASDTGPLGYGYPPGCWFTMKPPSFVGPSRRIVGSLSR